MRTYPRRKFIQHTTGALAMLVAGSSFSIPKKKLLLSFSSLGCPDWSFEKMVNFAHDNGYEGLELRTIQREMELPKSIAFNSKENMAASLRLLKSKQVKIVNLGASTALHHSNAADRKKNLDEGKRFIDLASQVGCPYIRVFPNQFPKDQEKAATIDLIVKGLLELGDFAKSSKVTVLMESHGEVVKSDDLQTIMKNAEHPQVGLIWDIVNMWAVTKEPPALVYPKLKKYIRHTHIKDLHFVDGKEQYTLLGKGEAPIFEGIDALIKGGYPGYFSFEWEKLWHPEIAEPEIALADYPKAISQHFRSGQPA